MLTPYREEQTLGQFALVSYIPEPLGSFLDRLRVDLVPGCKPRAHVTVVPPRPLHHDLRATIQDLTEQVRRFSPFRVELGSIEVFERTNVIFLGVAQGETELRDIYRALNRRELKHKEEFEYHPHITLAQNIGVEDVERLRAMAREQWAGYRGPRGFVVEQLSFVQHVAPSIWMDLAELALPAEVPVLT